MSTTLETTVGIIILILRCILFIGAYRIVWREFLKRRAKDNTIAYQNSYQRYLAIFSFTAMMLTVIGFMIHLFQTIKQLCYIGFAFVTMFYSASKIFLTFFQIARLQYCFADNQIYSKHGYPKWWFILLYLVGIIILVYSIFASLYLFGDNWEFTKFGVFYTCIGDNAEFRNRIINPIGVLAFIIWDWIVIVCYIIKIRQFYKKNDESHANIDESITNRIKFILYKITYLTFMIELLGLLSTVIGPGIVLLFPENNLYPVFIGRLLLSFENVWSIYVIYMMIDHNNDEYFKMIKILNRLGCFCCCKSFVTISLSMDIQVEGENVANDTVTKNNNEDSEQIERGKTFETKTIANDIGRTLPAQPTIFSATHYE